MDGELLSDLLNSVNNNRRRVGWYTYDGQAWRTDNRESPGHFKHRQGNPPPLQMGDLCQSLTDPEPMIFTHEFSGKLPASPVALSNRSEEWSVNGWVFLLPNGRMRALIVGQPGAGVSSKVVRWFIKVLQPISSVPEDAEVLP